MNGLISLWECEFCHFFNPINPPFYKYIANTAIFSCPYCSGDVFHDSAGTAWRAGIDEAYTPPTLHKLSFWDKLHAAFFRMIGI